MFPLKAVMWLHVTKICGDVKELCVVRMHTRVYDTSMMGFK